MRLIFKHLVAGKSWLFMAAALLIEINVAYVEIETAADKAINLEYSECATTFEE